MAKCDLDMSQQNALERFVLMQHEEMDRVISRLNTVEAKVGEAERFLQAYRVLHEDVLCFSPPQVKESTFLVALETLPESINEVCELILERLSAISIHFIYDQDTGAGPDQPYRKYYLLLASHMSGWSAADVAIGMKAVCDEMMSQGELQRIVRCFGYGSQSHLAAIHPLNDDLYADVRSQMYCVSRCMKLEGNQLFNGRWLEFVYWADRSQQEQQQHTGQQGWLNSFFEESIETLTNHPNELVMDLGYLADVAFYNARNSIPTAEEEEE